MLGDVLQAGWDPEAAPSTDVVPHGSQPPMTWLAAADGFTVLLLWGGPPDVQWSGDWPEEADKLPLTIRAPAWANRALLLVEVAGEGSLTIEDDADYDLVLDVNVSSQTQIGAAAMVRGSDSYPDPLTGTADRPLNLSAESHATDRTIWIYKSGATLKVWSTALLFARSTNPLS